MQARGSNKGRRQAMWPPPWRAGVGGVSPCQQAFRGERAPSTPRMQREQQGRGSDNGLIEKWPGKNSGGIRGIRRGSNDSVFSWVRVRLSPNCAKSNAAHCIQGSDCDSVDPHAAAHTESANTGETAAAVCSDPTSSITFWPVSPPDQNSRYPPPWNNYPFVSDKSRNTFFILYPADCLSDLPCDVTVIVHPKAALVCHVGFYEVRYCQA